jgi:hypothetical protein
VRSEWGTQSSGGGLGEPTWFLNPQFRLAVPTHTTVVLTVAQFDPKVRGRTHKLVPAGIHIYINVYISIYTHTHPHTYIYIYIIYI